MRIEHDSTTPLDDGTLAVRLKIIDDNGVEHWHRTTIQPGVDVAQHMDVISKSFVRDKKIDPIDPLIVAPIAAKADQVHTKELVAAYKKRQKDIADGKPVDLDVPLIPENLRVKDNDAV